MKLAPQVFVSHSKPVPEKIDAVVNRRFWKPDGGLWTSTLDEEGGQWLRWLHGEGYSLDGERWGGKLWLLEPKEANLFTVWTPREFRELTDAFPYDLANHDSIESLGPFVDWAAMTESYDGVYVPNPWPWRFGHEDMGAGMFFYGLDAECTCWFRWRFEGEPQELDPAPYLTNLNGREA